ncbi:MAG: hypothetical protein AMXMBFR7_49190 [Planctomycetota bacterium]
MITRFDIEERVREWGLAEQVVEKDYVLGWVLWGIANDPVLSEQWVFKGGTCLKKCYLETYRFSEDLDFTVLPGGPLLAEELEPLLSRILTRVGEESGIDFTREKLSLKKHPQYEYTEGRIYYVGPRKSPSPARIKLDLNRSEKLVRPAEARPIAHAYPDTLPGNATIRCYSSIELFAERLRAMGDRGRPRDLFDIVNMHRREEFAADPAEVRTALQEKCAHKQLPVPTLASITHPERIAELKADWSNMLGHQLPELPPVDDFLDALVELFQWLDGSAPQPELPSMDVKSEETVEPAWRPPATVRTWGSEAPIERIRYAAVNRLCVELGYKGTKRLIEPYSLRRTGEGKYILCAVRVDNREDRAYRVDRIESVRLTQRSFKPKYRIEFTSSGSVPAPRFKPKNRAGRNAQPDVYGRSSAFHVVTCPQCGRVFYRESSDTLLNNHKRKGGGAWCPGSGTYGNYVGMRKRK